MLPREQEKECASQNPRGHTSRRSGQVESRIFRLHNPSRSPRYRSEAHAHRQTMNYEKEKGKGKCGKEGRIGTQFHQVFLVSHVHENDWLVHGRCKCVWVTITQRTFMAL